MKKIKRIKEILFIIGLNCMIIFINLTIAINLVELCQSTLRIITDMILGAMTFFICKRVTKILLMEEKNVLYNKARKDK